MNKKIIIPAIDLINGKVVRLYQGDYSKVTDYAQSPIEVAKIFEQCGAERIHIVDLDGARVGSPQNMQIIKEIRKAIDIEIEVGGGIRDRETLVQYKEIGIDYVIVSSRAFNPEFITQLQNLYDDKFIVSLDLKDNRVMLEGWRHQSSFGLEEALAFLRNNDVKQIVYTEIQFDGTLFSRDFSNLKKYYDYFKDFDIIVSGGISNYETIENAFKFEFVRGVIIGKALYENKIDLKEAIKRYQYAC